MFVCFSFQNDVVIKGLTTKRDVMRIDQSQRSLAFGHMIICLIITSVHIFLYGKFNILSSIFLRHHLHYEKGFSFGVDDVLKSLKGSYDSWKIFKLNSWLEMYYNLIIDLCSHFSENIILSKLYPIKNPECDIVSMNGLSPLGDRPLTRISLVFHL